MCIRDSNTRLFKVIYHVYKHLSIKMFRYYFITYHYTRLLDLSGKVKERHMSRLIKNKCSMEVGIVLTDILNSYERISLRCLRIANYLSQKDKKSLTIHDLETMLPESEYHVEYENYKKKYQLA